MLRLASWTVFGAVLAAIPQQVDGSRPPVVKTQEKQRGSPTPDLGSIMHKKLGHAQKVLEGIALNDFDKIQRNADELVVLSKRAEWTAIRTPEYALQTDSFRRSAEDLTKAAKNRNVDGAALAYVELTMTCVKCHKYVRDTRRAQLVPGDSRRILLAQDR